MSATVSPPTVEQLLTGDPVLVRYTNWRGETANRNILVDRIFRGVSSYHGSEPIVLVVATDLDRGVDREFALKDMVLL